MPIRRMYEVAGELREQGVQAQKLNLVAGESVLDRDSDQSTIGIEKESKKELHELTETTGFLLLEPNN